MACLTVHPKSGIYATLEHCGWSLKNFRAPYLRVTDSKAPVLERRGFCFAQTTFNIASVFYA